MNKQALQERADSLQTELDQLKALIDKPVGPWAPDRYENYWALKFGEVSEFTNHKQEATDGDISVGNCHQTREQAQAALDRQKLKTEIINTIAELNDGWVPDWSDHNQSKHYIEIEIDKVDNEWFSTLHCSHWIQKRSDNLYLRSKKAAKQLQAKYTPEHLTAAYWG